MQLLDNLYLLPYSDKYFYNPITYKILDKSYKELPVINHMVKLDWYNGYTEYDMRIITFMFKSDYIPKLEIFKQYKVIHHTPYSFSIWFDKPVESTDLKGYYHIPILPRYLISKDGDVFDILRKRNIKYSIYQPKTLNTKNIKGGYKICNLYNRHNIQIKYSIHRLLLLVFKFPKKINPDLLYGNHIDGNPENNQLDNLEWVTPKENLVHAIKNGLMANSIRKIIYKNLYTGVTKTYNTIVDAAKDIDNKLSYSGIYKRGSNPHKRYFDGHLYKYDDGKPWPELEKEFTYTSTTGGFVGIDTKSNNVYYSDTASGLSRLINVNICSISEMSKGRVKKPVKGFIFKYLKDYKGDLNNLIKEK